MLICCSMADLPAHLLVLGRHQHAGYADQLQVVAGNTLDRRGGVVETQRVLNAWEKVRQKCQQYALRCKKSQGNILRSAGCEMV